MGIPEEMVFMPTESKDGGANLVIVPLVSEMRNANGPGSGYGLSAG